MTWYLWKFLKRISSEKYLLYFSTKSWMEADTKKYCCLSLRTLPALCMSFGYKTLVISSALFFLATAASYSKLLNLSNSNSSNGSACHSLRVLTLPFLYPTTGISNGTAFTCWSLKLTILESESTLMDQPSPSFIQLSPCSFWKPFSNVCLKIPSR